MHGSPKGILIIKRELAGDSMPDFSGEGYLSAKKKIVHEGSPCAMEMGSEDEPHDHEPMEADSVATDSDDESYESKVAKMKSMAQDMLKLSDELAKASETHAGQSEQLRAMAEGPDAAEEE